MKAKKFQFKNVKLVEGHFNIHGFEGLTTCDIVLQVRDMDKETIHKLQQWMRMNQLDYNFNLEQDFVKNTVKVDFYKVGRGNAN